jgi:hypothetical protein
VRSVLVLSAANPGAIIENVHIRHSSDEGDDWEEVLEDQVIIHTDTPLEKESPEDDEVSNDDNSENDNQNNSNENDDSKNNKETDGGQVAHEKTVSRGVRFDDRGAAGSSACDGRRGSR